MSESLGCSHCTQSSGAIFDVQVVESAFAMVYLTQQMQVQMCYKYATMESFIAVGDRAINVVAPGLRYVYPARIVGNVDKTVEFSGEFLGRQSCSRRRWRRC